ncbi:MAG: DUF547 domain-containing protein [Desulfobacterales bacterium]|nr:MAG: DUF547 domain-containing protein [Desulfobacterales bacterium]
MSIRDRKTYVFKNIVLVLVAFGFLGAVLMAGAAAIAVDHSLYADLLKKFVHNGKVNYQGFKSQEAELDRYLQMLERIDPQKLSRNEQFAFYANAYNAWTIKLILSGYPTVKSIKDLGSFLKTPWEKKFVRIDGRVLTLDDIEHKILRPQFKDPRVHFAINCAAKSCPPLRSEPYRGDILDAQLDNSTRAFLNDPHNFRWEGNEFYVSRIFKWFAEDFNHDVLGFYLKYATGDLKSALEEHKDDLEIRYLDYDWSLNGD